jgi:WD repeat-containing protein 24
MLTLKLHDLYVSAAVTRLRWRPPSNDTIVTTGIDNKIGEVDRHESMLAIATAPVKGAVAGGSGILSLWSYNRPYMPLSVLEGHLEGNVADFCW